MVYTAPRTWIDELSDAADFNVDIRDNQLALKSPPTDRHEVNEASDYAISTDTYTDVDTTDLTLSITTTGGDVIIGFIFSGISVTRIAYLDISVDGTRIVNAIAPAFGGITGVGLTSANTISFLRLQALAAGAHTFVLQWQMRSTPGNSTLYAGSGTVGYDIHPRFWVRELT